MTWPNLPVDISVFFHKRGVTDAGRALLGITQLCSKTLVIGCVSAVVFRAGRPCIAMYAACKIVH